MKGAFGLDDIISLHVLSSALADAAYKMTPEGFALTLLSFFVLDKTM